MNDPRHPFSFTVRKRSVPENNRNDRKPLLSVIQRHLISPQGNNRASLSILSTILQGVLNMFSSHNDSEMEPVRFSSVHVVFGSLGFNSSVVAATIKNMC